MRDRQEEAKAVAEDVRQLRRLGYAQELARRMSGFSNFAISLSIICILAGGVTSFHLGLCGVGGAAVGLGWPLVCLFSLVVAATMWQVASAFPTAGGLYHWAAILGGRGWGWATAWFNLAGLVTVLAAINVGAWRFAAGALGPAVGYDPPPPGSAAAVWHQTVAVLLITASQAFVNYRGIRLTTLLTDVSGYLILAVATLLTVALLACAPSPDWPRLWTFANFSGVPAADPVWPRTDNVAWLFALGFLLPAYTITGFDASAHTSEETVGAAVNVPRGIVRSVAVSGVFGWVMLCAAVLAAPSLSDAAEEGDNAFRWIVDHSVGERAGWLAAALYVGIAAAQYLCGLATVTSASRMAYAFARDGGLPWSGLFRRVNPAFRTPGPAIVLVSAAAVLFTIWTPVYSTITAVCVLFLYISYVLPTALGAIAHGRTWTAMGLWDLGRWYRPLAVVCVAGCGVLLAIGMAPPNEKAVGIVGASAAALALVWFGWERRRFPGPPGKPLAS